MRLVIENLPEDVEDILRREAAHRSTHVEEAVIAILREHRRAWVPPKPGPQVRDLSELFGSLPADPGRDGALDELGRAPADWDREP